MKAINTLRDSTFTIHFIATSRLNYSLFQEGIILKAQSKYFDEYLIIGEVETAPLSSKLKIGISVLKDTEVSTRGVYTQNVFLLYRNTNEWTEHLNIDIKSMSAAFTTIVDEALLEDKISKEISTLINEYNKDNRYCIYAISYDSSGLRGYFL